MTVEPSQPSAIIEWTNVGQCVSQQPPYSHDSLARNYDDPISRVKYSNATDTLACLRTVLYKMLTSTIDKSPSILSSFIICAQFLTSLYLDRYQSLNIAWHPRVDGVILTTPPFDLVAAGNIANILFVTRNSNGKGMYACILLLSVMH
jgi:acetylcholinesterase